MRNIELKVKTDFSQIRNYFSKFNPLYISTLVQKDTYYLLGKRRLKIREEKDKTELIYYKRKDDKESRDSQYFVFRLNKFLFYIISLFLEVIFGIKKVIEKQRDLFIYKNTRIHMDKVKSLGDFVELETVVKNKNNYFEYQIEQRDIINLLHLENSQRIAFSYSDLSQNL